MPPVSDEWDPELQKKVKEAQHAEFDIEQARAEAIAHIPKNHPWYQQGPHIICDNCKPSHSMYVGVFKSLTKNEEGEFMLTDRF